MAEFVVNTDQLRSNADRIAALQRELDSVAVRLGAMQLGSVLQIKASTALIARVGDCKWAAVHQSDNLGRLARGLDDIAQLYDNVEKNLAEPKTQAQADASHSAGSGTAEESGSALAEWALKITEWLGKKSVPFGLVATIANFCDGDLDGILSGLKNLTGVLGNTTKALFCGDSSAVWSTLLGLNDGSAASFSAALQKSIDDLKIGQQANMAGEFATFCKWAGYALTVVTEGFENYEENGLSLRFLGETVVESGVSILMSIGAGALIAAAVPVGTPAILVGAASAAVVWAVDAVVEGLTGKDVGEWASDITCGVIEWAGDTIESVGEWAGDAIESAGEWAGDAIESAGEWVGDRLEDAGNAIESAGEWVGDRLEDAGNAIEDIGEGIGDGVDSFCSWVGGLFD